VSGGPAVTGGVAYFGTSDGKVYALNATTGAVVWTATLGSDVQSVPAVVGGYVYAGTAAGYVYALNAATGATAWTATAGGEIQSSPSVVNGVLYIGSHDGCLYAFNATTGAQKWVVDNYVVSRASPAVDGNLVVTGYDNDELLGVDATTGAVRWTTLLGGAIRTAPTIVDGVVFTGADDGDVYAVDGATGNILWQSPTSGVDGTVVRSSPSVVDGSVYVESGETVPMGGRVWAYDAATGALLWVHGLGDYSTAAPAWANGVLFVASFDHKIYAFDSATGDKLWSLAPGDRGINSQLAELNGYVYVAALNGTLYALTDLTPPTMILDSAPAALTNQRSASFAFHPAETVTGAITCRLDSGASTGCSGGTFSASNLSAGTHTLTITATDLFGNVGTTTYSWQIDLTAPVLTVLSKPPAYTPSTTATIKLTASESLSSMSCQFDGGSWTTCTSPITYSGLADGSHTFAATGTDPAGNVSAPVTVTWTVDTIPPTVTLSSGPVGVVNSRSATFTFTSNESGATFKCSKNGKPYATCTSPYTINNLPDGPQTFSVYAIDKAGNKGTAKTWTWTVDATAPVVTITSGPANPTSSTTATFTFTSNESGTTFVCTIDGGNAKPCVSGVTYTGLAKGSHVFTVQGTDAVGNTSKTRSWNWKVV
jgi:outer membrane protein assembly factor BamB